MKLLWEGFDQLTGVGLQLQDDAGNCVSLPTVFTYRVEQGRQESALVGNGYIVSRDVEPSKLCVEFAGGVLTLEVKRDGWQT